MIAPIAFYAPLKAPDDPTPSGDRRVARLYLDALTRAGFAPETVSRLRLFDRSGDHARQKALAGSAMAETARLISRLSARPRAQVPKLWLTYHCHYKAPDLIGPRAAAALGIPYVVAEPSRSKRRLDGPWADFAAAAEAAIDAARIAFFATGRDLPALEADRPQGQELIHMPPFLDPGPDPAPKIGHGGPARLLSVAMMRRGDKLASYGALAAALGGVADLDWTLEVIGDGPARAEVEALFAAFGARVRLRGRIDDDAALRQAFESADLFVWPGVNEAYGMVYLEARAAGTPIIAEDRPGVRDVVAGGGLLACPDNPESMAEVLRVALTQAPLRAHLGAAARSAVLTRHSLDAAAARLRTALGRLIEPAEPAA